MSNKESVEGIWSTTDFPYQCLKDYKRTNLFHVAIRALVQKDDIVLDVGAGSGILSFFATEAQPKKVYAVEYDSLLASSLRDSIRLNGLENKVEVLEGDVRSIDIPDSVDVVLCELIETGLIEEQQAEALNILRKKKFITEQTKLLPFYYRSFIELGFTDFSYYGYKIMAPKHDWVYLDHTMLPSDFHSYHEPALVHSTDLQKVVDKNVHVKVQITSSADGVVNSFRFSSIADLVPGISVGATSALNGDKILPLQERFLRKNESVHLEVSYKMGGGLSSLKVRYL